MGLQIGYSPFHDPSVLAKKPNRQIAPLAQDAPRNLRTVVVIYVFVRTHYC